MKTNGSLTKKKKGGGGQGVDKKKFTAQKRGNA
jgi:hypothetical protein